MPSPSRIDASVLGYNCADPVRLKWLIDAVNKVGRRARRARRTLGNEIAANYRSERELYAMVKLHLDSDKERGYTTEESALRG